ncbi:autorepressor SdpR family transcription factor [Phenylobacterium sp.]|uniref:autorepressor SdpR family transcription factor n=1 Tax=Phenylobacterium sp. TaxID=1871053 RepID=UPI0025DC120A|nr:autorepressor SdpR family transcription factor [Phenylobacterium sp.]
MSEVYKALADPTRRRILQLLREREMSAGEIAGHFDLAKPTLSGHFAVLREARLVSPEKTGTTIIYRLNVSVLEEALMALMDTFKVDPKPAAPQGVAENPKLGGPS